VLSVGRIRREAVLELVVYCSLLGRGREARLLTDSLNQIDIDTLKPGKAPVLFKGLAA
jgi:hypothetical protein